MFWYTFVHAFTYCVSRKIISTICTTSHFFKHLLLNECFGLKNTFKHLRHFIRIQKFPKWTMYVRDLLNTKHEYIVTKTEMHIHIHPLLSWLTLKCHVINTHTFPLHTYTMSVTHPHEQNTTHLNLSLFLTRCAPSLNTGQSTVVATQLHTFAQGFRFSSGPALSAQDALPSPCGNFTRHRCKKTCGTAQLKIKQ